MRELRTAAELEARGITRHTIRWALKIGRWTLIIRGVYGRGPEQPSQLDIGRATALVADGVAVGCLSAGLQRFDNVKVLRPEVSVQRNSSARRPGLKRVATMPTDTSVIGQVRCLNAADTLLELASRLDDTHWEQSLEFCLRKGFVIPEQVEAWSGGTSARAKRIRRVVAGRGGINIPHTDSLLETMAMQLLRNAGLPTPTRQHPVFDPATGRLIAHLDLSWPDLGIFLELDGQQHEDQPVYDARRQTEVTVITGWRCGRLTWDEVTLWPESTSRLLASLLEQS
ncbi:MAG: hypothetical protein H0U92_12455 [Actinobacteria bacterium]|nr:hypothetical protein [Actinomycetota bacterium]